MGGLLLFWGGFLSNYTEWGLYCTAELELDETSYSGQLLLAFVVLILLLTYIQKVVCAWYSSLHVMLVI